VQHSQTARLLETVSVSDNGALDLRGFHPLGRIFLDLLSPTAKALQTVLCTTIPRFQVPSTADSSIGCALFTRRYLGHHCCFLFLRLMICLSSARSPTPQRCSKKINGAHTRRITLVTAVHSVGPFNRWFLSHRARTRAPAHPLREKQLAGTIPTA
jgi:hypothetical protein